MQTRGKKYIYWFFVLILLFIPILCIGDNLGLYYDSVYPDYTATHIFHHQEYEENFCVAWPLLTQIYHGTVNVWISAIIILLTGTTSVIQHRLINAVIVFFILLAVDRIFQRYHINVIIRRLGILYIALLPTVTSICHTQYYIELPGTFFVAISVLLLSKKSDNTRNGNLNCFFAFFMLGIAFYSYFNFLMFFPGFLLLCLLKRSNKVSTFLLACFGFLPGGCLYIIGYIKMFLTWTDRLFLIPYATVAVLLVILLTEVILIKTVNNGKIKLSLITAVSALVLFSLIIATIYKPVIIAAKALNAAGSSAEIKDRVFMLLRTFESALSGATAERMMLGGIYTTWQKIPSVLLGIVTATYLIGLLLKKISFKDSIAWKGLFVLAVYLICCLPIATRMQTQHFIPLVFLTFATMTVEISEIIVWISGKESFEKIVTVFVTVAIVLIAMNAIDIYTLSSDVIASGGNGYYTRQINELAKDALDNLKSGKKEAYIFPEWGFMSGFNYITKNDVAFSSTLSEEMLDNFHRDGYTTEIVYWNDEYLEDALDFFKELGIDIDDGFVTEYTGNDGEIDFYKLEVQTVQK